MKTIAIINDLDADAQVWELTLSRLGAQSERFVGRSVPAVAAQFVDRLAKIGAFDGVILDMRWPREEGVDKSDKDDKANLLAGIRLWLMIKELCLSRGIRLEVGQVLVHTGNSPDDELVRPTVEAFCIHHGFPVLWGGTQESRRNTANSVFKLM